MTSEKVRKRRPLLVQTRMDKKQKFMAVLASQRSALFDAENHVTSWKSSELARYSPHRIEAYHKAHSQILMNLEICQRRLLDALVCWMHLSVRCTFIFILFWMHLSVGCSIHIHFLLDVLLSSLSIQQTKKSLCYRVFTSW